MDMHDNKYIRMVTVCKKMMKQYAPEVRIEGFPTTDLEEGRDTVVLRCIVDSNPPSVVRWKLGEQRIVSTIETLQFRPVKRRDSGSYYCEAENSVGTSNPLSVVIDVKYPPRIRKVGPTRLTTAPLYSEATFSCEAEGNPPPSYSWLQKVPSAGDTLFTRGSEAKLRILNITYDYQGEYTCRVSNFIGGNERIVESESITIQVVVIEYKYRSVGYCLVFSGGNTLVPGPSSNYVTPFEGKHAAETGEMQTSSPTGVHCSGVNANVNFDRQISVHGTGEGGGLASVARFGADGIESLSETSVTELSVLLELFLLPSSYHIQYKNEVSDIFKKITVIISVVLVRIYINLVGKSVQHGDYI
ncbi:hypothetical protein RUM44_007251 [Polyplax serrata]|uniref:Ig-like domain-containing protein n=1 Tax=Polyplax serrata TaxID=468196 RepID=A0ABR1B075_POLSC